MGKQRDMCQAKEYDKTPEKALMKQITNLHDKEFKAIIIKMLTELGEKKQMNTMRTSTKNQKI